MDSKIEMQAIGFFHSLQKNKNEAPRQTSDDGEEGYIELLPGKNFEQALIGLDGVDRIWVVFTFHHNTHWSPMVQPPRGPDGKIGVFATRAPYRPNQIGLSCLQIKKIEGLKLHFKSADILDGSPILDIKPYLPYADSFPESRVAWLENVTSARYQVSLSPHAQSQIDWLKNQGLTQIKSFIMNQLEYDPTNEQKKRVKEQPGYWEIAYRTWRIDFLITEKKVGVLGIRSAYTKEELQSEDDPYSDKELHRGFQHVYASE